MEACNCARINGFALAGSARAKRNRQAMAAKRISRSDRSLLNVAARKTSRLSPISRSCGGQATSNFVNTYEDALGRRTEYAFNSDGNVTSVTR